MRRHIFISKSFFISIFLFIVGCVFLAGGIRSYKKYMDALDFKSFPAADYVEGKYVVGEIDTYLVKEIDAILGTYYSGQSEEFIHWFSKYTTYTIPIEDGRYIRVMIKNRRTVNKLEKFSQGQGEAVAFQGIVYTATDMNREWYQGIEGFDTEAILADVVIREVNLEDRIKMVSPGLMFLVMAVICFVFGDAIEIVTEEKEEI